MANLYAGVASGRRPWTEMSTTRVVIVLAESDLEAADKIEQEAIRLFGNEREFTDWDASEGTLVPLDTMLGDERVQEEIARRVAEAVKLAVDECMKANRAVAEKNWPWGPWVNEVTPGA